MTFLLNQEKCWSAYCPAKTGEADVEEEEVEEEEEEKLQSSPLLSLVHR